MPDQHFLTGKFLISMPSLDESSFGRSVIFMCNHDSEGAMGIVINKPFELLDFSGLLEQLEIDHDGTAPDVAIHEGGPVEPGRGFVLHSADYSQDSTLMINNTHGMTATVDILKAIVKGEGPRQYLVALGYAGWSPNQLEQEIQANSWMISDGNDEIIFNTEFSQKWPRAMAMLGVDISMLSADAGHA